MSSSSKLLGAPAAPGAATRAAGRGRSSRPGEQPTPARWEQSFDLAPGRSTSLTDRGGRHLHYSLAAMLLPTVRDLLALAERPLRALVLGCEEGYMAHCLLDWGVGAVLAIEPRADAVERAKRMRELAAIPADELEIRTEPASGLSYAADRFDIAIADGRAGRPGSDPAALSALAGCSAVCALIAPDRLAAAHALRAAGFGKPTLAQPPADCERRLIAYELNLMIARPETATARP